MARRITQLTIDSTRHHSGRGGRRVGAGRPRGKRPRVLHRRRARIDAHAPQHATIRVCRGLPTLRQPRFVRGFRVTLSRACARHGFRVVHYSIQRDHVHLLVEAHDKCSIACGMKSLGARLGKLANRLFQRKGRCWAAGITCDRFVPRSKSAAHSATCEVASPTTWLLRAGWRRHGLVDPAEVPG